MNNTEAYSLLFVDHFTANLIFGFGHELVLNTMKILGNYNHHIMVLISTIAATSANCINYLFGRMLTNILNIPNKTNTNYQKIAKFYIRYDIIFLLFMAIPLWGNIIALITGVVRINFFRFLTIGTLVKACYHAAMLYLL